MAIKVRKKGPNDEDEPEKPDEGTPASDAAASDPFLGATVSTASWIENNRGLAIGGIVFVIVAILAGFGITEWLKGQKVKASANLSPAFSAYETPIAGSPEMQTLSQAGITVDNTFETREQQWEKIIAAAEATLESTKKGELAQSARLSKGAAAVRLDRWDDAITAYEAYLADSKNEDVAPFVHQGLATAYAGKGDIESARAQLDELGKAGENFSEVAKFQEAIILDGAGKTDEAKDMYHGILEANPKTPYKTEIERRLALL